MTDKDFDALLREAVAVVAQEMIEEAQADMENSKIDFSERHKRVMDKILASYKADIRKKRRVKSVKRAAVILIACLVMMGASIFCVKGLRIKFLNYILEMHDTHTELKYDNSLVSDDLNITYIPEGFQLKEYSQEGYIYLKFEKNNAYFYITARDEEIQNNVDTEGAVIEQITINDTEAFLSIKDDLIILVFHDMEYYYTITGNIEETEIIKIAEGIEYIG